jgi:hypothetical protein
MMMKGVAVFGFSSDILLFMRTNWRKKCKEDGIILKVLARLYGL